MTGSAFVASLMLVLMILSSCTHNVGKFYPEIMKGPQPVTVSLTDKGPHKVSITYLGCGNLVLEQNGEAIMTDPFFSNHRMLSLLGRIRTNDLYYQLWRSDLEGATSRSAVQAMLVSHTHYDHVMDLPTLLHDHYFQNLKVVYGNPYLPQMLANFRKEGVDVDVLSGADVYDPTQTDTEWKWVDVTPKIRFLAIKSDHAPHTKNKLFMSKPLKEGYFEKNLIWHNDKVGAFKWTVGQSYSFLIDFIQGDTLRVFVQTSASHYPNGVPLQSELKEKAVDIAIMCYASTPNVENYPNNWVRDINPRKLILIHWEDFFKPPPHDGDYRLVRGTKPRRVRERIDQLGKKPNFFLMPKPGTRMDVLF